HVAVVLFVWSKDLLFLGRLMNPLGADLHADSGALSIDLILKIVQGVILGLHLILLRLELLVEGVDLGLQLSDVGAELGGVDVSELSFGSSASGWGSGCGAPCGGGRRGSLTRRRGRGGRD